VNEKHHCASLEEIQWFSLQNKCLSCYQMRPTASLKPALSGSAGLGEAPIVVRQVAAIALPRPLHLLFGGRATPVLSYSLSKEKQTMPRFELKIVENLGAPVTAEAELPDLEAARSYALGYASLMLEDADSSFWHKSVWTLDLKDHEGLILGSIMILGTGLSASP
jgi:hypothetical protein